TAVRELVTPSETEAPTRLADPLVGSMAGEYRIEERIGDGGMGVVYRAVHPIIGKPAAIKVLRHELLEDPEMLGRFLDEARAATAVGHRNIVQTFGFGTLRAGNHYIAMEYLSGEPLEAFVSREAPLPARVVVELLLELVSALGAAHAAGVVHRDLKPSNLMVMVEPDGKRLLKVLDFGVAKLRGSARPHTTPGIVLGTPAYMAPEQVSGAVAGPMADLYAVGIIGFELLTGRQPFTGAVPDVMAQHLVAEAPALAPTAEPVPAPLERLLRQLLSKQPRQRGTTEQARLTLKALARALPGASAAWLPPVTEVAPELRPTRPALPTMPSERASELELFTQPSAQVVEAPATVAKPKVWWLVLVGAALFAVALVVGFTRPAVGPRALSEFEQRR
ncbi:MAG: serine/threonine protein kinase, partial [Myxococcaceae bacterium]|nr:serine/threonine protein kinase [Myxococcaceae bacterium]